MQIIRFSSLKGLLEIARNLKVHKMTNIEVLLMQLQSLWLYEYWFLRLKLVQFRMKCRRKMSRFASLKMSENVQWNTFLKTCFVRTKSYKPLDQLSNRTNKEWVFLKPTLCSKYGQFSSIGAIKKNWFKMFTHKKTRNKTLKKFVKN